MANPKSLSGLLIRVGLTRRLPNGKLFVPFSAPPRHVFSSWRSLYGHCRFWGGPYLFRNLPGVIKWQEGRLLPRRWGFGLWGFEFGDRGA